jgi:hypothetical protein
METVVGEKIKEYCDFSNPEKVYILLLVPRKKDNPQQTEREKLNKRARFIITCDDDVDYAIDQLFKISDFYQDITFRVYLSANRRSLKKGLINFNHLLVDLTKEVINGNNQVWGRAAAKLSSEYKSTLAKKECRADKRFLLDIDFDNGGDAHTTLSVNNITDELYSNGIAVQYCGKTPNGYVVVCDSFNIVNFSWDGVEVKPDAYICVGCCSAGELSHFEDLS